MWVNADSPIIHIPILLFLKNLKMKVLSHMHIHNKFNLYMHSLMYSFYINFDWKKWVSTETVSSIESICQVKILIFYEILLNVCANIYTYLISDNYYEYIMYYHILIIGWNNYTKIGSYSIGEADPVVFLRRRGVSGLSSCKDSALNFVSSL